MSKRLKVESPLVQLDERPASIIERSPLAYINLRGTIGKGRTKFALAIKKVTGLTPTPDPNKTLHNDTFTLHWLGPDEYLLLCDAERTADVTAQLETLLSGVFCAVTDVSSGYTLIEVAGPYAADLLAKGCPLDLHPDVFGADDCAQSLLAQAGIHLSRKPDGDGFAVIVRRSYADYLMRWLINANTGY
ncbi:MAG: sarcosine oxidase subunit gamma [Gammaproteobacteria bacterium]|nr:sarcosine oxidase subunit gamma [Gammaproteobacteria bacterium]